MFSAMYAVSVLVVSLSLGYSAPTTTTPQDCEATVTPMALNPAKMSGRWNYIEGFADNDVFVSILKTLDSAWMVITTSPEDNRTLTMTEYNSINGTCHTKQTQVALVSDTTMDFKINATIDFFHDPHIHLGDINLGTLLPTCVNCLLFNFTTSIRGISTPIHTLHLFAREQTMPSESGLRTFRQQAKCLDFSLRHFHAKQDQEFCAEDNVTAAVKKQ